MPTLASSLDAAVSGTAAGLAGRAAAGAAVPRDQSSLDNQSFMNLILKELQQQDPFKPNDTQQLVEQISSLRNIESQQSLQSTLEALSLQSSMNQASSMIGKRVEALGGDGRAVSGVVERVNIVDNAAQLRLQSGELVPLSRVTSISHEAPAS